MIKCTYVHDPPPCVCIYMYVLYRCQLDDALVVYTSAAALAKDQREIEHIALYEKGTGDHICTYTIV